VARSRMPPRGRGTAWLLEDRDRGDYICSWYAGPSDGRLAEQTRLATSADAVAWGRDRTTRVRIRSASRTYWAGSAPRPEGFRHTWPDAAVEGGPATC
jgi:hypothetical protein